jgi:hypothetical protein
MVFADIFVGGASDIIMIKRLVFIDIQAYILFIVFSWL